MFGKDCGCGCKSRPSQGQTGNPLKPKTIDKPKPVKKIKIK